MRRIGVFLGLMLVALVTARLVARVYTRPLDVSGTWRLPSVIRAAKERDDVAYPAHVFLATVLEATRAAPTAVGLQWVKAAAHARTQAEAEQVAEGLAKAVRRAAAPEQFAAALCRYVRPSGRPLEYAAADQAGLRC